MGEPKSVWGSASSVASDVNGTGETDENCGVEALAKEFSIASVVSGGIKVDLIEASGAFRVEDCDG